MIHRFGLIAYIVACVALSLMSAYAFITVFPKTSLLLLLGYVAVGCFLAPTFLKKLRTARPSRSSAKIQNVPMLVPSRRR